jgi:hypothetical protein
LAWNLNVALFILFQWFKIRQVSTIWHLLINFHLDFNEVDQNNEI